MIRDLENGPRLLRDPLPFDWLTQILSDTEVSPVPGKESRLSLTVEKTDAQVLIRGRIDVTISLPCSRTLDPAIYELRPEVFLLLSPKSEAKSSGMKHRARKPRAAATNTDTKTTHAKGKGKPKGAWDEDPELEEQDAAQDFFSGDQIILDPFLREFILLEVPMVPLREDLRSESFEASPSPPSGTPAKGLSRAGDERSDTEGSADDEDKPLDPRLSPLAELKARLEKKKE